MEFGKDGANNLTAVQDWSFFVNLYPVVITYTYWDHKAKFDLEADTYIWWCLFAVESGSFRFEIEGTEGIASAGDLVLCPPGTAFKREVVQPLRFHFWYLTWKNGVSGEPVTEPLQIPFRKMTMANQSRLRDNFQSFKSVRVPSISALYDWRSHYLNDLWKEWCFQNMVRPQTAAPIRDSLMEQAVALLREKFGEPLMMKQLARQLGLSPVQFIRRFRAAYGQTPVEYLTDIRLEHACELIRGTRLTIDQIALACGYSTGFYLSKMMKSRLQLNPTQYRNLFRV